MADLYVKLDIGFLTNERMLGVSPLAELLFVRALLLAKQRNEDGYLGRRQVENVIGRGIPEVEGCAAELVKEGVWADADDGWRIVGWLDRNMSSAEIEDRRQAEAERKRTSRASESVRADDSGQIRRPGQRETETERKSESIQRVFDAWVESTGKHKAVLDNKRQKIITARLDQFTVDDLVLAVQGWKNSPFHRGENERHKVYNDLELFLRDAKHVEEMLDYARSEPPPGDWMNQ